MTTYQKFQRLNIDHSVLGLDQNISYTEYFCTPLDAEIIAEAGVDGIHYCFIKGFDEMVFAISPSNLPGENVHPIAKNFEELLRLLLACGSMDAIEQTYMWDEELFEQYIMDNKPSEKQQVIMDMIKEEFHIIPMEQPFFYIKDLQASFDYRRLEFSEEYYELLPDVGDSEKAAPEWQVTYEGGFYPKRGREGKEIRVDKDFKWGKEIWHIPAVYLCSKGMVVDLCIEVEPEVVAKFINKWNLYEEDNPAYSNTEYEQIQKEHPLNMDFHSKLFVNDTQLRQAQGCCVYWIPKECMPEDLETETEAKWVLDHYGYDYEKAWAVHRISYPWTEKKPRTVRTLEIQLEREMVKIPSKPFATPEKGKAQEILNSVTGVTHTLIVREYEEKAMDPNHFPDESMEWPTHYSVMTYTLFPELEDVYLKDACQGDSPRSKQGNPHRGAMSVGIIGLRPKAEDGEDYYHPDGTAAKLRVCCSSMYFEKPAKIEWELTFKEKRVPDIKVKLI